MILPGLSGSYLLLLMGNYTLIMVDSVNALYFTLIESASLDFTFINDPERLYLLKVLMLFTLGSIFGLIFLSNILSSLLKNFKTIIVDNAGNTYLKKKIEEKVPIYKYILNKKNCGWSKAINQGIKQCDTEYILILQADCSISNKDISILLKSHKKYENCFMTSPTYYDEESKLSYNGGCLPEKNLLKRSERN